MKTLLVLAILFVPVLASAQTHAAKKTLKRPLTAKDVMSETESLFFPFFAGSPLKRKKPNELTVLTSGSATCDLSDKA